MTDWLTEEKVSVTNAEGPPVPIPNTEVKLCSGENTLRATAREDSSTLTQARGERIKPFPKPEKRKTSVKKPHTNHKGSELSRLERVPDKHEVGGSSPLGPTSRLNLQKTEKKRNSFNKMGV